MNVNQKARAVVSFEISKEDDTVEIHGNAEALLNLADKLKAIAAEKEGHDHLQSKEWGGEELSSTLVGEGNRLVHHVKVFCWDA